MIFASGSSRPKNDAARDPDDASLADTCSKGGYLRLPRSVHAEIGRRRESSAEYAIGAVRRSAKSFPVLGPRT